MTHKFNLSLCLLTSAIWASTSIPVVFSQTPPATTQQVPVTIPLPAPSYNNAALIAQDLPTGFKEIPPELAKTIQTQFEILSTQLSKAGMKPEKYFAFVDEKTLQIVVGFTGLISNPSDQANFDSTVKQLQQPEYQKQMIDDIKKNIKPDQALKILEYGMVPTVNNSIADTSSGMTVGIDMQGQLLQLDLAAFRRSNVGAFTAIMYRKGDRPTVNLDDIARKLDTRIVQTATGTIPTGTTNTPMAPSGTTQMK
ncbi:hypothetical protein [Floridanema evergladense]|uniref:Uncharacterized protein n=1 Tax=Floridaenema evergladense BLCC-F167 TaxID=3153639 RepID=A0ABV4WG11_9CYAN